MFYPIDRSLSRILTGFFISAFFALPAYAEVSDKIPTLAYIWSVSITSSLVCFGAGYVRKWLLCLSLIYPVLWFTSLFLEIHSADVGPAILAEAGESYLLQSYCAALAVIASSIVGWLLNNRREKAVM